MCFVFLCFFKKYCCLFYTNVILILYFYNIRGKYERDPNE